MRAAARWAWLRGFLIACASSRISIEKRRDCAAAPRRARATIGRERDVAAAGLRPLETPAGAAHQLHAQVRREPPQLAPPVPDEARRRDDQRRRVQAARLLLGDEVGDRLQRLAEPHVVGQHAARAVRAQVLQPAQAVLLVRAQRRAQVAGHRRRSGRAGQSATAIGERGRPRPGEPTARTDERSFDEGGVELAERAGARGREAHPGGSLAFPSYSSLSTFTRMRSRSGGTVTYWFSPARSAKRAAARRQTIRAARTTASTEGARAARATGSRAGRRPRCRARG